MTPRDRHAPTGISVAEDLVVLLDPDSHQPVGSTPRATVHTRDTPLHLAFSCYIVRGNGEVLLTRRALSKRSWPGVWTNSCCGHPRPEEDVSDAVRRRVADEVGLVLESVDLVLPHFAYRAVDASGVVENEVCPVYVARVGDDIVRPDLDEVCEYIWSSWEALEHVAQLAPRLLSPWAALQIPQMRAAPS